MEPPFVWRVSPEADDIAEDSDPAIERRTQRTIPIWKEVNAVNAALVPVRPAVVVRGVSAAQYETRFQALQAKKTTIEETGGAFTAKRSDLKTKARKLDRWNKDWYQAWGAEFPPATQNGDALAGVDTEAGTALPQVLEIVLVTQQGLSLQVRYDEDTGQHATVLELLWKVNGVPADYLRVAADTGDGNLIGPFAAGQVIALRTDVGNSRDNSELGPEQAVTIA